MKLIWTILNYFIFLYPLYMSFVWTTGALLFYFRRERKPFDFRIDRYPFFSILIPAHNEARIIRDMLNTLNDLDYPAYEVIVIDDNSTDATARILDDFTENNKDWFKVIHLSPNSGKAAALNAGILFSKGELILTLDADCFINKDVLKIFAWHFVKYPRTGAVTGNPRIINRTSLLGKIQIGEYSSIIGLIKRTQRILGKILTVSGVIAAFRKSALCSCGLFDSDTVTEDIDITWKLQKKFWDVKFEPHALCWILAPETWLGLWRQRIRWGQGGIEVLRKHRDIWFDARMRRFWPIYLEYIIAILWSFSLASLILSWFVVYALYYFGIIPIEPTQPFIPPVWTGSILALVCLLQSVVSFSIDYHYENKTFFKYYFWIIWYPFFYWLINAAGMIMGVFNVFIRRKGVSVKWESPDRGLHTIK
ncbi:MAG: poly-beta-1,6 N-acetyl-D-glucosamine synthase [Candidatus Omnitrophica bacterium]|nr:poly-beta-1,6 N-acetyl-D-glucosamine synthase [Candidatus Omnitrophota bacterium]